MKPIIKVENLSKQYTIGGQQEPYSTLRESLVNAARFPVDLFKRRKTENIDNIFWALKDINFEVVPGEVLGIVGRNGAGKSTLLKVLSRITDPSEGRIELFGRVASLLEVGTGFHSELTGRENIFLNGAILGMKRNEIARKFDEIVDFAEIEKFIDTPVKRYSSGMYVRLAFAVASSLEPEILIVDEVLAVGDSDFQKKCLGKMDNIAKGGRTVLFVSHNLASLLNLCDKGALLEKGKLVQYGKIEEIVSVYSESSRSLSEKWQNDLIKNAPVYFDTVSIRILGKQPKLSVELACILKVTDTFKTSFVAFDISDSSENPIMQAIPRESQFIEYSQRHHAISIVTEIELPPMVPGRYFVSCWIGSYYTETIDWIKNVIMFEVLENPVVGRTVPYGKNSGYLVPNSSVNISYL